MGDPVGSQVVCLLVDDWKIGKIGPFMRTRAAKIALVLLGLFVLIVRPIGAAEPAAAPGNNAAEREIAAIAAEFHKLQGARAAVQTYPESHDLRKRHVAMLQDLYQRAKKFESEFSYGPLACTSIHTELNHFGIVIPDEHRWTINDNQTVEPKVLVDPKTQISYYLESDGRHISAIDRSGKILWHRDPFNDAGLWPYRLSKPVITYFKFGPNKQAIDLSFNSSQFGSLDMATGTFQWNGQD